MIDWGAMADTVSERLIRFDSEDDVYMDEAKTLLIEDLMNDKLIAADGETFSLKQIVASKTTAMGYEHDEEPANLLALVAMRKRDEHAHVEAQAKVEAFVLAIVSEFLDEHPKFARRIAKQMAENEVEDTDD